MDPRGLLRLAVLLLIVTPLEAQLSADDFDSYAAGSTIAGQGDWQTWDLNPAVDAEVSNLFANSPPNSLELQPGDDIVRLFNGINSGTFVFTSQVYIPSGQAGEYFFILLNTYNVGGPYNWSAQISINDATGQVSDLGGSQAVTGTSTPVPVIYNAWVEVRVIVDLTADTYDAFYGGQQIMAGNTWTGGVGASQLQCLDLYNDGGGTFYYDDVSVDCQGGCGTCLPFDSMQCDIDCNTNDVTMNWSTFQPGGYASGIQVLRNGSVIATLPGTATSYSDLGAPLGQLDYEVIGDCGGGQTWSALCSVACTGACPPAVAGDECCDAIPALAGANAYDDTGATESPDAYDDTLCTGTFLGDMIGDLWFTYTSTSNGFLRVDTCAGTVDTDVVVYEGACGLATIAGCSGDAGGACGLTSDVTIPTTTGSSYLIRVGRWGAAVVGGPGTLTITELCEPAFTGLSSVLDCTTTDVTLSWDPATFDSFDVIRDGVTIASALPAGTGSYADLAVGTGVYAYEVVASCPNGASLSQTLDVNVAGVFGVTDLIIRGEQLGGEIDSVAALDNALQANGLFPQIIDASATNVIDIPCIDDPALERVWVMLGSFPSNRDLTQADGATLVALQALGKHIYLESGDTWGFDAATPFSTIDGIADTIDDGDDSFVSMNGANSGFGLDTSDLVAVTYAQDQTGIDYTDQLIASATDSLGPDAGVIWSDASGTYDTGVFYSTSSGGKVICQSWEFGGFGLDPLDPLTSDPLRNDLALRYLDAFAGTVQSGGEFVRGDANADGTRNIADAISILGVLFPQGTPPIPVCEKALDANDDGGLNIADAISLLGVLFPNSSPPPVTPAPAPGCGQDPTLDNLTCLSFPPCP